MSNYYRNDVFLSFKKWVKYLSFEICVFIFCASVLIHVKFDFIILFFFSLRIDHLNFIEPCSCILESELARRRMRLCFVRKRTNEKNNKIIKQIVWNHLGKFKALLDLFGWNTSFQVKLLVSPIQIHNVSVHKFVLCTWETLNKNV